MRLYSYVVASDSGFAPNPFWGCCTLATCKPSVRRSADEGDWIVGLASKRRGNRIIYAMKVDEVIDIASYYRDRRFLKKRPQMNAPAIVPRCGDNIYEPLKGGVFRQLPSGHSNGEYENSKTKKRDLGGLNVLVGTTYYYFGADGPELPHALESLRVGRGHKCRFPPAMVASFVKYISKYKPGVIGRPTRWPEHDRSWGQDKIEACAQ